MEAAASSRASGRPSSRRHNSATAAAFWLVSVKPGWTIPGPIHEQPHRRGLGEHRQGASGRGNAKRIHPPFLFSAQPQHYPAGHQHPQPRRPLEQICHRGRGAQHVLEVIEHEQHVPPGQAALQGVRWPLPAVAHQAER